MKQIIISFDENGEIKKDYGTCDLREISLASKVLESEVMGTLNFQNLKNNVKLIADMVKEELEKESSEPPKKPERKE